MTDVTGFSDYYATMNSTSASAVSSVETGDSEAFLQPPSTGLCLLAFVCSIIFTIVGTAGNLITVIALTTCRRLRNATTAFVVSLAVADFLFCAINLPLTAVRYANQKWTLGDELCAVFPFLFYGNVAASLLFMTAITLNRFILINHYHLYEKIFSRTKIILMITCCWGCSFLILTPTLFGVWGRFGYKAESFSCTILPSKNGMSPKKLLFIIGFFFPVVTIIISYSCIFYKVRKSAEKFKSHEPTLHPKSLRRLLSQRKREMQVTRTMLIIFCSFLICFLPLMIVNVFEKKIRYPEVHILASILAWMSSCTNPFIYVVLSRHYRQAYLSLLCPRCSWTSSQSSSRGTSMDSIHSVLAVEKIKIKHQISNC